VTGGVIIGSRSVRTPILILLTLLAGWALGGCLFDSDDESDSGTYEINGYVLTQAGAPIEGVEMKAYFDTGSGPPSTPTTGTFTDSRGFYRVRFNSSVKWLRVRPVKDFCDFSPYAVSYNTTGRSIPSENFVGYCGSINQIEGHIRTPTGDPVQGVAVLLRETGNLWNTEVYTDAQGLYIISSIIPGHTYVVKPTHAGYSFDPPQRTYPDLVQDFTEQDFIANPVP
jgi:hypothetical protein